jgi:hypothetical protein
MSAFEVGQLFAELHRRMKNTSSSRCKQYTDLLKQRVRGKALPLKGTDMRTRLKWVISLCAVISGACVLLGMWVHDIHQEDTLYQGFQNPPAHARPFVRWWWHGNRITEDELLRELDIMQEVGLGGIEINPIAMADFVESRSGQSLTWLSPEWCEMVRVAAEGARARGMVPDMIVGTGWPFGGEFLAPEEKIQKVTVTVTHLTGPAHHQGTVPPPHGTNHRIKQLRLYPKTITDITDYTDLTNKVAPDGTVTFMIPPGEHTLYMVEWLNNFHHVTGGAPGGAGPVLDHFNRQAVEKYLERVSTALGPFLGGELGPILRALFCDSLEFRGANWTTDFPEQFYKRRGYRVDPYLAFILDMDAAHNNPQVADTIRRTRYDYCVTLAELLIERLYLPYHAWCHENGVKNRFQAYGYPWLYTDLLDGYLIPDIPEGDLWLYWNTEDLGPVIDDIRYAVWNKYAASAAHLTDKNIVSSEAMTNVWGVFKPTLEQIKRATDINFISGANHCVLHGYNYSPPEAGFPGWMRFGTYFSEHNTWWKYIDRWIEYTSRLSWIFQHSHPQVQIAILGPLADVWGDAGLERVPAINTPWYLHELWQAFNNHGYSSDYINHSILKKADVTNGRIAYGPMSYQLLVLADVQSLDPATATVITDYVNNGGQVMFVDGTPSRSPSFESAQANDAAVKKTMDSCRNANSGRTLLLEGPKKQKLMEWAGRALASFDVEPSVDISPCQPHLFHLHHVLEDRDVYFFSNIDTQQGLKFHATFPTGDKTPWRWDPETGERSVYAATFETSHLTIHLSPLESLLLVFEPSLTGKTERITTISEEEWIDINGPWDVTLTHVNGEVLMREMTSLINLSSDRQLQSFAGTAQYRTTFDIDYPGEMILDLGTVHDISEVELNGENIGVCWWGSHRYHIYENKLTPGTNTIEIKITNVLNNYCQSLDNNATARAFIESGTQELLPSGLLGPVRLYKTVP